jgi:hypothetical protein
MSGELATVMIGKRGDPVRYRVDIDPDVDTNPREYDSIMSEDVAAWQRGEWRYVGVTVTPEVRGEDIASCSQSIWGVGYGTFPGDTVMDADFLAHEYPGPDLLAEVKAHMRTLAKLLTLALNPIEGV